ncbi:hypothetical protein J3F84DRAFT_191716 [Trichoderma pleuroticola]
MMNSRLAIDSMLLTMPCHGCTWLMSDGFFCMEEFNCTKNRRHMVVAYSFSLIILPVGSLKRRSVRAVKIRGFPVMISGEMRSVTRGGEAFSPVIFGRFAIISLCDFFCFCLPFLFLSSALFWSIWIAFSLLLLLLLVSF